MPSFYSNLWWDCTNFWFFFFYPGWPWPWSS
jgi:hypothetical protein